MGKSMMAWIASSIHSSAVDLSVGPFGIGFGVVWIIWAGVKIGVIWVDILVSWARVVVDVVEGCVDDVVVTVVETRGGGFGDSNLSHPLWHFNLI